MAWSTAGLFTRLIPLDSWTMLVWRGFFGAFGIAVVILALERRNAVASFQKMNWPSWLYAGLGALAIQLIGDRGEQPVVRDNRLAAG
ncbi:MAG TPA: hypothetical protein VF224_14045 [Aestuariivirga sp.]